LSGSTPAAVKVTERLALVEQLVELVPGGHGSVIDATDAETVTVGA